MYCGFIVSYMYFCCSLSVTRDDCHWKKNLEQTIFFAAKYHVAREDNFVSVLFLFVQSYVVLEKFL